MLTRKKMQNQTPHREPAPYTFRYLLRYSIEGIFLVLVCLFLAWRPIQITRLKRDIEQLQKLKTEMIEINARLNLEKAALTCSDRIEEKARREYGFIDPDTEQVIDFIIESSSCQHL